MKDQDRHNLKDELKEYNFLQAKLEGKMFRKLTSSFCLNPMVQLPKLSLLSLLALLEESARCQVQ